MSRKSGDTRSAHSVSFQLSTSSDAVKRIAAKMSAQIASGPE